jgi:hypothetical protein
MAVVTVVVMVVVMAVVMVVMVVVMVVMDSLRLLRHTDSHRRLHLMPRMGIMDTMDITGIIIKGKKKGEGSLL